MKNLVTGLFEQTGKLVSEIDRGAALVKKLRGKHNELKVEVEEATSARRLLEKKLAASQLKISELEA